MSITEFDHTLGTFGLYPTAFMCVIPVINTSDRFRFDCLRVHVTQALIKQTVDLSCSAMKANSVVQVFPEGNLPNAEDQIPEAPMLSV